MVSGGSRLRAGRPSKYRTRSVFPLALEENLREELDEICYRERKNLTEYINELLLEDIERKKVIGREKNPIGISFGGIDNKASGENPETLDMYMRKVATGDLTEVNRIINQVALPFLRICNRRANRLQRLTR